MQKNKNNTTDSKIIDINSFTQKMFEVSQEYLNDISEPVENEKNMFLSNVEARIQLIDAAMDGTHEILEKLHDLGVVFKDSFTLYVYSWMAEEEENFFNCLTAYTGAPFAVFKGDDKKDYYINAKLITELDEWATEDQYGTLAIRLFREDPETGDLDILTNDDNWEPVDDNHDSELSIDDELREQIYENATLAQKIVLGRDDTEANLLEILITQNDGTISDEDYEKEKKKYIPMLFEAMDSDCFFTSDEEDNIYLRGTSQFGYALSEKDGEWSIFQFLEPLDIMMTSGFNESLEKTIENNPELLDTNYVRLVGKSRNIEKFEAYFEGADEDFDEGAPLDNDPFIATIPLSENFAVKVELEDFSSSKIRSEAYEQSEGKLTKREKSNLEAFCKWYCNRFEKR